MGGGDDAPTLVRRDLALGKGQEEAAVQTRLSSLYFFFCECVSVSVLPTRPPTLLAGFATSSDKHFTNFFFSIFFLNLPVGGGPSTPGRECPDTFSLLFLKKIGSSALEKTNKTS